ncbi:single-stranded-DNA-specific exonuclease RecJ [Sutterella seckii]|uniref:Single-stranded-DNA-specific exonuclease RecJ n=1 Tax=Sutterella seckii TaxID=1944635 RepID=A0A6I1EIH9_9BURK|nr:single-stranded-DNA-specific exonuclease RecJ [Sutterella seckii]KAB7658612.1 single-stranded-DNA-specific exonuclease RecJ [Sutterella seckii]
MTRILSRTYDPHAAERLARAGFLPPIARALAARGISEASDLEQEWQGMIPPAMLEGTREAAERLAAAREKGEHVTIVADYDCDGATACTVGLRGFQMLGISASYFVPDRVVHGYGLTPNVVDIVAARDPKPSLIVTVDNGISSVPAVDRARELGIDVIVTDHHLPGPELPRAVSIVNPNRADSVFPSKNLAGVGVIYYVLLALRALLRERGVYDAKTQPRLDQLVDFVALGTVADVVKLDKNNRILVSQGLRRIRSGRTHAGLEALFAIAGKDTHTAGVRDFGFAVAPRINAAGRLGTMESGIECLLSDDPSRALAFADNLNSINAERRELEGEMQQAAEAALEAVDLDHRATFSLYNPDFNEGVVGLVAARLKERIHRPVIAFAPTENHELKGSGRSIPGIHLRDMIDLVSKALPGVVIRFGGHAMAAGLSIRPESLKEFQEAFEEVVRTHCDASVFERVVLTDGGLAPDEITENLCTEIDRQIWGQGFEAPLFANEFTVLNQTLLKDAHLKLQLGLGGQRFEGIFFRHREPLPMQAKIAYRPAINEYRGRRTVQLVAEAAE